MHSRAVVSGRIIVRFYRFFPDFRGDDATRRPSLVQGGLGFRGLGFRGLGSREPLVVQLEVLTVRIIGIPSCQFTSPVLLRSCSLK